jgi:cell wall-associated NlpC family hydrolase
MQKNLFFPALLSLLMVFSLSNCALFNTNKPRSGSRPKPGTSTSSSALRFRQDIVSDAKSLVGSPYKYAGRAPSGFDCSGFTSYVLGQANVKVSPASAVQGTEGKLVDLDRVLPGDLVFFGLDGKISHVALVVERNRDGIVCVHSTSSRGVIVENVSKSTYWEPRIMFARDVIGRR